MMTSQSASPNMDWELKPSQQCIGRSQRFGACERAQRYDRQQTQRGEDLHNMLGHD
jgi:hypothetical protein